MGWNPRVRIAAAKAGVATLERACPRVHAHAWETPQSAGSAHLHERVGGWEAIHHVAVGPARQRQIARYAHDAADIGMWGRRGLRELSWAQDGKIELVVESSVRPALAIAMHAGPVPHGQTAAALTRRMRPWLPVMPHPHPSCHAAWATCLRLLLPCCCGCGCHRWVVAYCRRHCCRRCRRCRRSCCCCCCV